MDDTFAAWCFPGDFPTIIAPAASGGQPPHEGQSPLSGGLSDSTAQLLSKAAH